MSKEKREAQVRSFFGRHFKKKIYVDIKRRDYTGGALYTGDYYVLSEFTAKLLVALDLPMRRRVLVI